MTTFEDLLRDAVQEPHDDGSSIFAELTRRHPEAPVLRFGKRTLLALSWAIEDLFCTRAERPVLFGAFQQREFFEAAEPRWEELARVALRAVVFADFGETSAPEGSALARVDLGEQAPMLQEWTVVCDSPTHAVVLAAREVPGQESVPDARRLFDAVWSVDARAVRDAARACARVAHENGYDGAAPLLFHLAEAPHAAALDPAAASAIFTEVVGYLDREVRATEPR